MRGMGKEGMRERDGMDCEWIWHGECKGNNNFHAYAEGEGCHALMAG